MSRKTASTRASHWTCREEIPRAEKGDAVFGWFRKRAQADKLNGPSEPLAAPTPKTPVDHSAPEQSEPVNAHVPGQPEQDERDLHEIAPTPGEIVLAAPSSTPSMPLGEHPNILGVIEDDTTGAPRLLDPDAALSEATREQLAMLLTDLFGARGRYRLEWRPNREPGDDAMFAETMVADLVRRIQNTIAETAELEASPNARRRELRSPRAPRQLTADDDEERERALDAFLKPAPSDAELLEALTPNSAAEQARRRA